MSETTEPRWKWPLQRTCPLEVPPGLAEIREQEPITKVGLWDGSTAWLATRYHDIRSLLGNPALSSDTSREGFPQSSATAVAQRGGQKSFVRTDPPVHDGPAGRSGPRPVAARAGQRHHATARPAAGRQ